MIYEMLLLLFIIIESCTKHKQNNINYLDHIYISDNHYGGIKVVKSAVTSDHMAIIAYSGEVVETVGNTRRICKFRKFRKRMVAQHAKEFQAQYTSSTINNLILRGKKPL